MTVSNENSLFSAKRKIPGFMLTPTFNFGVCKFRGVSQEHKLQHK